MIRWLIVWALFRKEAIEALRDRRTLFMMIGLPVLLYPLLFIGAGAFTRSEMAATNARLSRVTIWGDAPASLKEYLRRPGTKLTVLDNDGFTAPVREAWKSGRYTPPPVNPTAPPPEVKASDTDPQAETPVARAAREWTLERKGDAVVVLWPGFASQIDGDALGRLSIFFDTVRPDSTKARERLTRPLGDWRRDLLIQREQRRTMPPGFTGAVEIRAVNVAPPQRKAGMLVGTILCFLLILMSAMGGFYTSIDLTAGEKERGTMQTLLCAPVSPNEIICGKFLAVWSISFLATTANLVSMALTAGRIASAVGDFRMTPGILGLSLIALMPISFLLSALYLAVAAFAKDFKEGQNYLTPLMVALQMPMIVVMSPTVELSGALLFAPIVNVMLLVKALFVGEARPDQLFLVLLSSVTYAALAILLAARVFNSQNLMLGGKESFGSIFDFRPVPGGLPSPALAIMVFAIVMVVNFYVQLSIMKLGFVAMLAIVMYGIFLMPPVAVAAWFQFSMPRCFRLYAPHWLGLLGALLIGLSAWAFASGLLLRLLPPPPSLAEALKKVLMLDDKSVSLGLTLFLVALSPAICEEALFRGFILSGLRSLGQWPAIVISALLFAVAHGSIYRMLPTLFLGLLLGYAVWKTGSLLAGVVIHALNNGIAVWLAKGGGAAADSMEGVQFLPLSWTAAGTLVMLLGLLLVWRAPAPAER
jgi:sodium transport system permease protein